MNSPYQKSHLSQVFLKTTIPCEQLASLLKKEAVESVLEIGPGKGILTKVLLDQGFKVTCVEKDLRFVEYLKKHFDKFILENRLTLVNEDILKFDFEKWRKDSKGRLSVCGNIPYNISSPLLEVLLPELPFLEISALLVQLEFAERLVSPAGLKSYGSLSVFAQLRANLKLEFKVDKHCFSPVPKVDSAIVSLQARSEYASDPILKNVEKLTKLAFSQRRKKLSNAISDLLEGGDVSSLTIDLSRRPDTLRPEEYLQLARSLKEHPFFSFSK